MRRFILVLSFVLLLLPSCGKRTDPSALVSYWSDSYSGEYGIHVSGSEAPAMLLAGKPFHISGVNCYNLFIQCFEHDNFGTADMEEAVKVLSRQEVPIVRFSCGPYYASQMWWYTDRKEDFLSNLEKLASLCDESHILLIPSFFWNSACVPEYSGEPLASWGDISSKTYSFMLSYTRDIMNVLKDHKCLAAWEFGNEFNLQADIESEGYPELPAAAVGVALKGFGDLVRSLDPHGRLICSGHSIMRNAQWNLSRKNGWTDDTFGQYSEITGLLTPDPVQGVSEHIYEERRKFSDIGELDRENQLLEAKEVSAALGKVYYVGEFTGPKTALGDSVLVKSHFSAYSDQKIQLALIWNYALRGDVEWSFKEGDYDNLAFRLIREYNNQYIEE